MKSNIQIPELVTKTAKESIKNIPFVLATSIPGVGSLLGVIKDSYDDVKLELELEEFRSQFDKMKKEEYTIKNINGIEIFFEVFVDPKTEEFIDNLETVLSRINEDCIIFGTYGCVYKDYVLYEDRLQIIFDDIYDREYVDEYIEKIASGIDDTFHDISSISKVLYY